MRSAYITSVMALTTALGLWGVGGSVPTVRMASAAYTPFLRAIQSLMPPAFSALNPALEASDNRAPSLFTASRTDLALETSSAPATPQERLEIDLELDSGDRVVEVIKNNPRTLEAAWKSGGELLLAYGYALQRAGRHREALAPLAAYHEGKGRLASYAALLLGESSLELHLPEDATRWLTEALAVFPAGERQIQARFGLARGLFDRNEAGQAVVALEQLLESAPKSQWRYEIRLKLAYAYEKNGQLEKSISAFEWLWAWVPARPEAEIASRELVRLQEGHVADYSGPNSAVRYRRALRLLESGQVEPGLSLMLALAQDPAVTAALPRTFAFELARAYFQAKQYTEAAEQFDRWYRRARPAERAQALFWRALTQGRLARFDDAVILYRQLAREYPSTSYTETGMYKIGLLRLDQTDYAAAEGAFIAFKDGFPRSRNLDNAQWYVAWSQLRQGRYDVAQASFDELVRRFPRSELLPGVRYWQGRMAEVQGNKPQAVSFYRQVLQSTIPTHYQAFAEIRLEGLGQPLELTPVDAPLEAAPALALPHPEVLERIMLLLSLGLRTWAQEELSTYEHGLKNRDELLAMAGWYRRTGNYAGARMLALNLGMGDGIPRLRDPSLRYQLAYPQAFSSQLSGIALPLQISWELVYAIMRQESEYKPWATSKVGARGLMQVIPATAHEVCQNRKLTPPVLKHMYRPEVSVQYGVWHLEDLMNHLQGRLPLVIAAYNAGPEAIARWMKDRPVDPIDVFMEEISYSETRRYVRKVLTNLWVYQRLHADGRTGLRQELSRGQSLVFSRNPTASPDTTVAEHAASNEATEPVEP